MKKTKKLQIPEMHGSKELVSIIYDMINIIERMGQLEPSELNRFVAIMNFYKENENHPDLIESCNRLH